jgi:hypothetical protein
MLNKPTQNRDGLYKGIAMAYIILLLHLVLIAGLGLVVIFLTGIATYLFWIVFSGMILVGLSGYLFYRKLRREGRTLGEILRSPTFQGREVEVSLLGGMATMRLGGTPKDKALDAGGRMPPRQLEDSQTQRIREIQVLAELLEKDLITREEFDQAKHQLFNYRG